MRLTTCLIAATLLAPAAPLPVRITNQQKACARTSGHTADEPARNGSPRLMPRKLSQLPDGRAYMAVYRQIGGCEAPLTMVDYRSGGRR